ncbi:hypothetical protein WA556_002656 [Blastocystis sp. ATCC 50177/Nand II]
MFHTVLKRTAMSVTRLRCISLSPLSRAMLIRTSSTSETVTNGGTATDSNTPSPSDSPKEPNVKHGCDKNSNEFLHKSMDEIMTMCLKNPNALFSVKQTDGPFPADSLLLHRGDSIVEMNKERVVIGDTQSHQLLRVNDEDVKAIEHYVVLDMKEKGERWEGDVLNDQPYGWGVLYDSENRKKYEGFRIGDVNVCYGRSYYPDNQMVEYEGEWCEGKRMGDGVM